MVLLLLLLLLLLLFSRGVWCEMCVCVSRLISTPAVASFFCDCSCSLLHQ